MSINQRTKWAETDECTPGLQKTEYLQTSNLGNGNHPRSSMALMLLWALHIPSKPLLQKNEWDPESYEILHPNASECVTPNNVILLCNQMDVRI